eukprot:3614135-Rhodomonas_salina.1
MLCAALRSVMTLRPETFPTARSDGEVLESCRRATCVTRRLSGRFSTERLRPRNARSVAVLV